MIKFDFKVNSEALKPENFLANYLKRIAAIPHKAFTLKIGQNTYKLKYKLNGTFIDLYSEDNTLITKPVVRLNVGDVFPECLSLDIPYSPKDYTIILEEGKGLSNNEIEEIMQEINKKGILNIILNS
jgi:hypothetical protein